MNEDEGTLTEGVPRIDDSRASDEAAQKLMEQVSLKKRFFRGDLTASLRLALRARFDRPVDETLTVVRLR